MQADSGNKRCLLTRSDSTDQCSPQCFESINIAAPATKSCYIKLILNVTAWNFRQMNVTSGVKTFLSEKTNQKYIPPYAAAKQAM